MLMKILNNPIQIAVLILLIGFISLSGCSTKWYKGNLHAQSYWSDGDEFPEMAVEWYKSRGYDFVALSEHNILAEGEKWVQIRDDSLYQNAFNNYLSKYGEEWVDYSQEDGKTKVKLKTFEEYTSLFEEDKSFLIIKSEEITDRFENKRVHLNATNIQTLIPPQGGKSVLETLQNNIDAVLKQRDETGVPVMVHVNHPNFHYSVTVDDMKNLKGGRFFEVYNGHPQVHNLGDDIHMGTEEMWDQVNISYLQKGQPLLLGLATDDTHHYHRTEAELSNAGRGWVMVQANSLSPSDLILAMEDGRFYSSTGVSLNKIKVKNNKIDISVQKEKDVDYKITFIGCKKGDQEATVLQETIGHKASFEITPDILFVRAKIRSTKIPENPVEGMDEEMAWTQPITYLED